MCKTLPLQLPHKILILDNDLPLQQSYVNYMLIIWFICKGNGGIVWLAKPSMVGMVMGWVRIWLDIDLFIGSRFESMTIFGLWEG